MVELGGLAAEPTASVAVAVAAASTLEAAVAVELEAMAHEFLAAKDEIEQVVVVVQFVLAEEVVPL